MEVNFEPNIKQNLVFDYFDDATTTEVLYGGSVGGGKSYMLCALLLIKSLQYPGIRIGLARNELTTLKKTTIVSFFEVANDWGIAEMFSYNSTAGIIKFNNGSEIVLVELTYRPSDPLYTRLGGHLFTFGVVDEVGEVDEQGYSIFNTRIGRWKNEELNVKPICISTCNPTKNWLYKYFYKKFVDGELEEYKKFIQALPTDNPFLPTSYLKKLETKPYAEKQRLLYGNWDYDDNKDALMEHQDIINIFDNVPSFKLDEPNGLRYISCDIAFTSDKMIILVWEGFSIVEIVMNPTGNIEEVILNLAQKYKIPQYNITYDSDGVGKFLTTRLRNAKPIVNNAKALNDENYKNLKTQLYFKLAEKVNDYSVKCKSETYKDSIIEELQVVQYKPSNVVGKIEMVDKGTVKRLIGRSPDFSDAMAYRMIFEYKKTGVKSFKIL
jgi:phage terminase large subunit